MWQVAQRQWCMPPLLAPCIGGLGAVAGCAASVTAHHLMAAWVRGLRAPAPCGQGRTAAPHLWEAALPLALPAGGASPPDPLKRMWPVLRCICVAGLR